MNTDQPISLLMILTLLAALGIGIFVLMRFRRRNDHHPMAGERERNIGEIRREAPNRDGTDRPSVAETPRHDP